MIPDATASAARACTIEGRGPVSFADLYDLFTHSGFMPEDKARLVAEHRADVERTFARLEHGGALLDWVRARDEQHRTVGYLSTAWCYRRTTMFQHLAAVPGFQAGGPMVVDLMDRIDAEPQCDFMKFYFLADNPYPARIYGSFGESAGDGRTCMMSTVAHLVTSVDATIHSDSGIAYRVRPAAGEDLDRIDEWLADHESPLRRHAEDLAPHDLALDSLNRRYQRLGLFRQRQALLASDGDTPAGFALIELSSPGLNLSEGLSAFRVHVFEHAQGDADGVRAALIRAAQDLYRAAGRRAVLGLVDVSAADAGDASEVASYQRLGLRVPATSKCIIMHRSRFGAFRDHVARLTRCRRRVAVGVPS